MSIKESYGRNRAIRRFVKKAKELLSDELIDILIYGSVVRGEAKPESDIDMIVIVNREEFESQMKLASLAFDILMDTGEYISVQAVKSKDFNRDTIFMRNVREEAIHVAGYDVGVKIKKEECEEIVKSGKVFLSKVKELISELSLP